MGLNRFSPGGASLDRVGVPAYVFAYRKGASFMADSGIRRVRLFRNNRNQAVRIPVDFELPGVEATMRREGDCLIIEPLREGGLLALLAQWEPMDEVLPDVDEGLLPLRDVEL